MYLPEAAEEAGPGHGVEAAGGAGAAEVPAAAVAAVPVGARVEHEAAHLAATLLTTLHRVLAPGGSRGRCPSR